MITTDTLTEWRKTDNKMDHHPSAERELQLIDSHLEALEELELLRERLEEANKDLDYWSNR